MLNESQKEQFHQCLRIVDVFLKEGKYGDAKEKLAEARTIDPTNPYITAFEERIRVFESKSAGQGIGMHAVKKPLGTSTAMPKVQHSQSTNLGQRQESVKEKMDGGSSADATFANLLQEEREKLKRHQHLLEQKYEQRIREIQQNIEEQYHRKLEEEIASTEERLRRQYENEHANFEKEVVARLQENYQQKVNELEQQLQANQINLLEKERQAFAERERKMKEEFNRKLLEGIRKTESLVQEQTIQQQEEEKKRLKERLEQEYEKKVALEREALSRQYEEEKEKLLQASQNEQRRLQHEFQQRLSQELEEAKRREMQKLEEKRMAAIRQLEQESRQKYQEQLNAERKRMQMEFTKATEEERLRLQSEYEMLMSKQKKDIQKVRRELEEQFTKRLENIVSEYDHRMNLLGIAPPSTKEEALTFYKQKMQQAYSHGQLSVDATKELIELKEILELTYDEHLKIETDVRLELYVSNVEKRILSGELMPTDSAALNALKQQFNITMEESAKLEPYILASFEKKMMKGRILLADDDPDVLSTIEDILTSSGFQVVSCDNVNDALEKLNTISFDMIISDIKFLPGEPDGFKFFNEVQAQPKLQNIPFIFLSSLTDGVIVRTGVQLGVDDYLTKPIDPDLLIATIEGKLKRSRMREKN